MVANMAKQTRNRDETHLVIQGPNFYFHPHLSHKSDTVVLIFNSYRPIFRRPFQTKVGFSGESFLVPSVWRLRFVQQWVVHVQRLFLCQPVKSVGATLRWGADQAGYGRILQKFQNIGCASPFGNQHSTLSQLHSAVDRWWIYTTTKHRGEGGSACGVRALQRHDQATGGIMGLLPLLLSSTERSNDEGSKNKRHTTTYGSPTLSLGRRTWHPWHSCPFSFVEMSTLNACTLDLGFWDETPSRDGQLSGYVRVRRTLRRTHVIYEVLKCRRECILHGMGNSPSSRFFLFWLISPVAQSILLEAGVRLQLLKNLAWFFSVLWCAFQVGNAQYWHPVTHIWNQIMIVGF